MATQHHTPVVQILVDCAYLVAKGCSVGEALDRNTYVKMGDADYTRAMAYIVAAYSEDATAYEILSRAISTAQKDNA